MASVSESYVLEIGSGLYQGVTRELGEGRHVVGSGENADLVLLEEGLAARHAAIILEGLTLRVESIDDAVEVQGAGPVPPGSARTVALPAVVDLGGLRLSWRVAGTTSSVASDASVSGLRALMRRPAVPGIVAAGFLAATVLLTVANPIAGAAVLLDGSAKAVLGVSDPLKPAAAPPEAPAPVQPANAAVPTPAQPRTRSAEPKPALALAASGPGVLDTASTALKRDVEQAGLLNVHIQAGGGAVAASGTIEPSMASRWQSVQQSFDERFAGEVTLVNSVAVKAEKLPASLGIEGVWRGPQPYIVVRGQRYLVGAVLDGGWAIRGIERDRVMLERDGRLVAMRF